MTDSTFLQFTTLPSEPNNHYRSVRGEVSVQTWPEVPTGYAEFDITAAFSLANNGQITTMRFDTYVTATDGVRDKESVEAAKTMLADIETMNAEWLAFYTASKSAVQEALGEG